MGKKVFVSYKYSDSNVYPLARVQPFKFAGTTIPQETTVRHYVDELQDLLAADDHINKGENDNESLAGFKDSTIESKLRAKIHDSSITLVMISPNMKDAYTPESDQWIPWEIAYSLKEHTRNGRTSLTNAMMAIILPDATGSYSYFLERKSCCLPGCITHSTDRLFQIHRDNMFNIKVPNYQGCSFGSTVYTGESSYIPSVKWCDFKTNVTGYLNRAVHINENIASYNITQTVA